MELGEIRDKVLQHDKSLSNFDNWAQNMENRIVELEKGRDLLGDIKVALMELKMSNTYFREKLDELKKSIDCINKDNKEQHDQLGARVNSLEGKPGRSWDKLVWIIVAAGGGGIVTYILTNVLK